MTKILAVAIAVVLVSGTAILISGISSEAHSTPVIAKSDRLDAKPFGSDCSQATWPYYEASCLRNTIGTTRDVKSVRVVTTDRAR